MRHRSEKLVAGFLFLCCAVAGAAVLPTTAPTDRRRTELETSRKTFVDSLQGLPQITSHSMNQILRIRLEGDLLLPSTSLGAGGDMTGFRGKVDGYAVPLWVSYCELIANNVVSRYFELRLQEYPDGDLFREVHVRWRPGLRRELGEFSIETKEQTGHSFQRVLYMQSDTMARLNIFSNGSGGDRGIHTVNFMERSFGALRRNHPQEVQQWLRPVFHQLRQDAMFAPDLNIAWQVLAEHWPVQKQTKDKIQKLIPKLLDGDYRVRKSVGDELAELGRDGATALMQVDRDALTAEQNARVDEVIARFCLLGSGDARRMARNSGFLLDCEYCDDALARRLAAEQLARVLGAPLELDLNGAESKRYEQIEKLRNELTPPISFPPSGEDPDPLK